MDILDNLTDPQREAVVHMDGPMLVVAGAGSGKTRVVTRRIAHLVSRGVWPNQILAMTFTNKAANEMKERVEALAGARPPWVGTFHSMCARFLRRDIDKLDDPRDGSFTIYDEDDRLSVIKSCLRDCHVAPGTVSAAAVRARISSAKCRVQDETADVVFANDDSDALDETLCHAYEKRMRELNALDFDDLLLLSVRLLASKPALRDVYHGRFRYLLVDEYQDTNRLQYLLMKLLTGPSRNVHATGDPDQSIYSWRGAEYRNILDFTTDYPDAKIVRLEQNYRSTKLILRSANELIRQNTRRLEKELFTENMTGIPIRVAAAQSDREEAQAVVGQVMELRLEGVSLREMAVFYRTNAQSRPLEDVLLSAHIPYQIVGGLRFYERKEVKDALAHLRLLVNPRDAVSLQRVVDCRATGVGRKTLAALLGQATEDGLPIMEFLADTDFPKRYRGRCGAKLAAFAAWCAELRRLPRTPVGNATAAVLEYSGLIEHYKEREDTDPLAEGRLANLNALLERANEYQEQTPEAGVDAFLEEVALVADVDYHDPDTESLALMTLHASKGLEFPYVFIVGVEEGYLPHENVAWNEDAVEEERRLLYVGITRAKQAVYLSYAATRYLWNEMQYRTPSRFVDELPTDEVEFVGRGAHRASKRRRWDAW
ncbi:MAG: UvrD-helicase domain-containing protein [Lentisphaeria bacterium]|nr:UvrD-helicase domain-containing protein [Lentisphaeria bacterium]